MKYLGVILDYRLSYSEHLKYIAQKATMINRALCRLISNLRGPSETNHRLFGSVIQSVIMYAAPVWSEKLNKSIQIQRPFSRIQRILAIRIIAGYRTISTEMALILAKLPPWHLVAKKYRNVYIRISEAKRTGQ